MDFIGLYWFFTGFYWVLLFFYWVLLGFYWVLLGFTGFYWVYKDFLFTSRRTVDLEVKIERENGNRDNVRRLNGQPLLSTRWVS